MLDRGGTGCGSWLAVFLWIGHAGVEHALEREFEARADIAEFGEGEGGVVELSVVEAVGDEVVHEFLDFLRGGAFEAAGGAFDGIGETEDGAFFRGGFRTGIAEVGFTHLGHVFRAQIHDFAAEFRVALLVEGALVEVADEGGAVVFTDGLEEGGVEFVFESQIDAFLDVGNNDEGAHGGGEVVVGILAQMHILGEILGFDEFPDVVEIGGDAANGGVRADFLGGGFGEVGDSEAVMVGAGCLEAETLEQGVVEVRHFEPGNIGGESEEGFEDGEESADHDGGADAHSESGEALPADHGPVGFPKCSEEDGADLAEGRGEGEGDEADIDSGADEASPAADLGGEIDGNESRDEGDDEENGVDGRKEKGTPEAGEDGGVESVVFSKENREDEGGECVGNEQGGELEINPARFGLAENDLDHHELDEHDAENKPEAFVAAEGFRVVDPELGERSEENEETDEKILERFGLIARENQEADAHHENQEDEGAAEPPVAHGLAELVLLTPPAGFAGRVFKSFDQFAEKSDHGLWRDEPEAWRGRAGYSRLFCRPRCFW